MVKPSVEEEKPNNDNETVHSVKFISLLIMFFGVYNFIINTITKSLNIVIFHLSFLPSLLPW